MNQTENDRNHSNNSQLEEGELVDDSQFQGYPSLDLNNQSFQHSNPQNQSSFQFQPGFNTASKPKRFDLSAFQSGVSLRLKGRSDKPPIYQGQNVDVPMTTIGEVPNEQSLELNESQPNVIGNEDSQYQEQEFSDKEGDDYDEQNEQTNQNFQSISKISRQSHNTIHITLPRFDLNQSGQKPPQPHPSAGGRGLGQFSQYEEVKMTRDDQINAIYQQRQQYEQPRQEISQSERLKISSQEFAGLMKSKQDIYNILLNQGINISSITTIGQFYLPPYHECTIEFLRDTFSGKKKLLFTHEVRIINVPKMNELNVNRILSDAKDDRIISLYLPDLSQKKTINRQYLFNIINTLKPDFFPQNIRDGLEMRKEMRTINQNKYIDIQSDMYSLLKNSINLNPSQRGRAVHLLNVGAKKRKQPTKTQSYPLMPAHDLYQCKVVQQYQTEAPKVYTNKRWKANPKDQKLKTLSSLNHNNSMLNQTPSTINQSSSMSNSKLQPQYQQLQ